MEQVLIMLKNNKHRTRTKENYLRVWRMFNNFIIKLDKIPSSWEERLLLFIAYLIDRGSQSSTVKSYVSAIKCILVDDGYEWNDSKILLSSLTRACRLKNDRVTTRLPILGNLLELILFELSRIFKTQPNLLLLYRALFSVGFYGLFRVGELTESDHVMKAVNVHIATNKDKIMIVLYTSKTHGKESRPQKIKICSNSNNTESMAKKSKRFFCPFQLLRLYMERRQHIKDESEQLFIFTNRQPVKPVHARTILKDCIRRLGLNDDLYNVQSLHIGRASEMLKFNYSLTEIKRAGHWRSNAVYKYLRD